MPSNVQHALPEVTEAQIDRVHRCIDETNGFQEFWQVESEHDSLTEYTVKWHPATRRYSCTCTSWAMGSGPIAKAGLGCKHILWVMHWKIWHDAMIAECRARDIALKAQAIKERRVKRLQERLAKLTSA